jgi:DNA (cytosine-5)-methyltransferase 1
MRHGSLFSCIGGFDLAAEWMGWENVFHCEVDLFRQKILKYYWPNAKSYTDITKADFSIYRGVIDILTGGFPCQPYSVAGKRKGKEDDRHLWPEMLRAIREIQPRYVVGENVYGLVNWSEGLVFEEVQADLENEGYEVQSIILPACSVNAPHRRDRIWIVANRKSKQSSCETVRKFSKEKQREFRGVGIKANVSNSNSIGLQRSGRAQESEYSTQDGDWKEYRTFDVSRWESISPVCRGDYGLSRELSEKCLEGLGNAIVPQVAYEIFKAIKETEVNF